MTVHKVVSGRVNTTNVAQFVGERGQLFYDETVGILKLSDGHTPGGVDILTNSDQPLFVSSSPTFNNLTLAGNLLVDKLTGLTGDVTIFSNVTIEGISTKNGPAINNGSSTFNSNVYINGNSVITGSSNFGGNVSISGNLLVTGNSYTSSTVIQITDKKVVLANNAVDVFAADTSGLYVGPVNSPYSAFYFSVGTNAWVSSVGLGVTGNSTFLGTTVLTGPTQVIGTMINTGESIFSGNIYQTGQTFITGNTTVTGNIYVTGNTIITGNSVQTGQSTIVVTPVDVTKGAVVISGNTGGTYQTPINSGVMLHVTGQPSAGNNVSRIYNDSQNNYSIFIGRRYNGTVDSPSQVLANSDILRVAGTAYTNSGWANIGPSRISFVTNEDLTATNQGGRIEFWATANAAGPAYANIQRISTVDPAVGVWATKFTTPAGINAAGTSNMTTVNGSLNGPFNGTIGATTPNSIVATSVTTTNGGQLVGYLTGAIGANTANSGAFTTVSTSSTLAVSGTANFAGTVTAATVNATSIGNSSTALTGTSATIAGTVTAATLQASTLGNSGALLTGTLTTNAQPYVNSLGTLSSLNVTANVAAGNLTTTGNIVANVGTIGNIIISNTNIYSSLTAVDLIIGQLNATANLVVNRSMVNNKDVYVNGNTSITQTLTAGNIAVAANGKITVPTVVINDGGIKTVSGGTPTVTLNFGTDSIVLVYQPTGAVTFQFGTLVAGSTIHCIVNMTTAQNINLGVNAVTNSSLGKTVIGGAGNAPAAKGNEAIDLVYTCIDGTAANTYVSVNYV